jgi:hypothetical protein
MRRYRIDFTNQFRNSSLYMIYMQSQSQATACGWQQAGTWNISFAFQPISVSPAAGRGNQRRSGHLRLHHINRLRNRAVLRSRLRPHLFRRQ